MNNKKIVGLTLAATAALAFTVIPATSFAATSAKTKVPCYHANACKGQNSCKGKGAPMMKMMTEKHCKKMGGSLTAPAGAEAPAAAPAPAPAPTEAPAS